MADSGTSHDGRHLLISMELAWWEATGLAILFVVPFFDAALEQPVTYLYFAWAAVEVIRMIMGRRQVRAFPLFAQVWREHVRRVM